MVGVGPFEMAVGLLVAAVLLYLVLSGRRPLVLISLMVVLSPILGLFVAVGVAYLRYALFG